MTDARRSGFVYIFLRADGLRKLGWTTSVLRRQSEHQAATGLLHDFEMSWEMGNRAALRVEQIAHSLLSGFGCSWSREVYELPLAPIMAAVERAMERAASQFPDGLATYSPPRPKFFSDYKRGVFTPPNWDKIIPEANAYLLENPELERAMTAHFDAVKRRLEYSI
jgi:hypothetical protein